EALLLHAPGEVVVDTASRGLAELERHVAADDLEPGLEADLRDPGTQGPEPDHADPRDLHGARSYRRQARSHCQRTSPSGSTIVSNSSRTTSRPASSVKRRFASGSQPAKYISAPSHSPRQPGLSELGKLERNQPPRRSHAATRSKSGPTSCGGRLLST